MSERIIKPGSKLEYEKREVISRALEDERYLDFATKPGPLLMDEVPSELRESEHFKALVGEMGWPQSPEDDDIEPTLSYPDDASFRDAFMNDSMVPVEWQLKNYRYWLLQPPNRISADDVVRSSEGLNKIYGSHPALHRLYGLMPEEVGAVQQLLSSMAARNPEDSSFNAELTLGVNEDLVQAVHLLYRITGRLLKVDDGVRHYRMLHPHAPQAAIEKAARPILSAHHALRD